MTVHERPACSPVEGTLMRLFVDDAQPTDSPEHRWTETTWEGTGKVLTVPTHWHRYHDEYLTVLEGELDVLCDRTWRRVTPSDGTLFIKRYTVHGFTGIPGVRMVLKESCQPDGDYKEAYSQGGSFFRDLSQQNPPSFWLVMRVAYDWDLQPSLSNWSPFWLDTLFITVFGAIGKFFAPGKVMEAKLVKT